MIRQFINTITQYIFEPYISKPSVEQWFYAVANGHTERVKSLIKAGAQLDVVSETGNTALRMSAIAGHTGVAQVLIKAGANLDLTDEEGNTALIFAAFYKHKGIVEALIKAGANLNLKDTEGNTALMIATFQQHIEAAKALNKAEGGSYNAIQTQQSDQYEYIFEGNQEVEIIETSYLQNDFVER